MPEPLIINKDARKMKMWIKILIGLLIFGTIAAICAYYFLYNKPHPDFEKMEAAFTIPAQELYLAYTTNKTEADKKFTGKIISITGLLKKIEAPDSLVIAVFVFEQGDFGDEGIRCTFLSKFGEQANKLIPEAEVKLKGFCTGFNDTDVILEKCSILTQ